MTEQKFKAGDRAILYFPGYIASRHPRHNSIVKILGYTPGGSVACQYTEDGVYDFWLEIHFKKIQEYKVGQRILIEAEIASLDPTDIYGLTIKIQPVGHPGGCHLPWIHKDAKITIVGEN